jgi:transposase
VSNGFRDAIFGESFRSTSVPSAVRGRIDWKYALSLELTDPGFDFTILSEFRERLINQEAEPQILG